MRDFGTREWFGRAAAQSPEPQSRRSVGRQADEHTFWPSGEIAIDTVAPGRRSRDLDAHFGPAVAARNVRAPSTAAINMSRRTRRTRRAVRAVVTAAPPMDVFRRRFDRVLEIKASVGQVAQSAFGILTRHRCSSRRIDGWCGLRQPCSNPARARGPPQWCQSSSRRRMPPAGQHLEKDAAERPDVRPPVRRLTAGLLGAMYAAVPRTIPGWVAWAVNVGELTRSVPTMSADRVLSPARSRAP